MSASVDLVVGMSLGASMWVGRYIVVSKWQGHQFFVTKVGDLISPSKILKYKAHKAISDRKSFYYYIYKTILSVKGH